MSLPGNGIYVVRNELSTLITAMHRTTRWNAAANGEEEKEGLLKLVDDLKQILNRVEDLRLLDPYIYLTPFLEVIRTDETTGAVTSLALASINKFLLYGLIDPTLPNLPVIVENIADAVTHARFMGSDQSSDGVTLFRVVEVLDTLMRSPEGSALSNEAVCEIILSCFKICFEPRLTELHRRFAERASRNMVLLLFMRLPQFSEDDDRTESGLMKKFQMMAASMDADKNKKKQTKNSATQQRSNSTRIPNGRQQEERKISTGTAPNGANVNESSGVEPQTPQVLPVQNLKVAPLATTPTTPAGNIVDMQGKITQTPKTTLVQSNEVVTAAGPEPAGVSETNEEIESSNQVPAICVEAIASPETLDNNQETSTLINPNIEGSSEYINSMGVRFTQQTSLDGSEGMMPLVPYGLPCIQELFRFLIMLCNPLDKQNNDTMMHMGLSLLTVAFEVAADNIGKYDTLLEMVKDDLCRHLIALLNSERVTIFAADLQLCFLIFEALRGHLKLQLEAYLKKITEIIASDNIKTPYEIRELALDNLRQLCRIPGFVAELYINYDCDLYCSDLFESLTNLLSKVTLSATSAIHSTHILALETLVSVIENIENNCIAAKNNATTENPTPSAHSHRHSRHNSGLEGIVIDSSSSATANDDLPVVVENISKFINVNSTRLRYISANKQMGATLSRDQLLELKLKKRILSQGTELFNQKPDKGISFLQENGILNAELDPKEVALFLRENPGLNKKQIGEYITKKKNVDQKILKEYVESFDFTGLRVDQALRLYLETFRLPGEAPLIFLVMEHFASHWHQQNGEPFGNTDAAFRLAYAIIMLNMDQHNTVAKRLNVPMTQEDFLKNLRNLNDGKDFDQDMLTQIFNAIKNEEIIMPAEQTGVVRDNYLWKVLLRRGATTDGSFHYVEDASYDDEIFRLIWGPTLSALTFMFDRSTEAGYQKTLNGFMKFAGISAHYQRHEDFDTIILTLCKLSTLFNNLQQEGNVPPQHNEIIQAVNFGLNPKAQAALKTVFILVHDYGDCLREGWKNILDIYLQLFKLKLLPKPLTEVEDFCEPNGKAQLVLEKSHQKQEAGIFSISFFSYLSSEGQREPSAEEQEFIKIGRKCIKECQLEQMIQETKFVQVESLQELMKAVLALLKPPNGHKSIGLPYSEDIVVFWMEFLVKVVIHNRDRMIPLWSGVRDQMYLLLMGSSSCGYDYLMHRCIVAVLKLAIYLMRNDKLCPIVLQSLKMLLMLKPSVLLRISKQISIGIYELLKTSAQNIHSEQDWQIIFTILECVGAGAIPPEIEDATLPVPNGCAKSDGALSSEEDSGLPDKGYISDSEISNKTQQLRALSTNSPPSENWIMVNKDSEISIQSRPQSPPSLTSTMSTTTVQTSSTNHSSLVYDCKLVEHSPFALFKCWNSLSFIVRNVAHITPYNYEPCVKCLRTFVEATKDGGLRQRRLMENSLASRNSNNSGTLKKKQSKKNEKDNQKHHHGGSANEVYGSEARSDAEEEDLAQRYETLSIQLLDLMYTLYTRTAQIFRWWAKEGCCIPQCSDLWGQGWCPLLQGIARLAMDRRREVRTHAISCLQQRALLVNDLQSLSGSQWASCFQLVLFPLLNELLPESSSISNLDPNLLEESRIRTATIMSKVFLHHLTSLIELGSAFNDLWLEILNYIEKFMKVGSDMLSEQMLEILKNMLLVMHSLEVFRQNGSLYLPLWELTWHRIGSFLPKLKDELFRDEGSRKPTIDSKIATNSEAIAAATPNASHQAQQFTQQQLQQQQQQQPSTAISQVALQSVHTNDLKTLASSPLVSPIESPRHSIILQAASELHGSQSLLLGQVSMAHSMPILVPPTSLPTSPITEVNQEKPAAAEQQPTMVSIGQANQQLPHAATAPALHNEFETSTPTASVASLQASSIASGQQNDLPDLMKDVEQQPLEQQQLETGQNREENKMAEGGGAVEEKEASNHCSFSIDFADVPQQPQNMLRPIYAEQTNPQEKLKLMQEQQYKDCQQYFQQIHFQHSQENQQQLQQIHQEYHEIALQRQQLLYDQQQLQMQKQQHQYQYQQTLANQSFVSTAVTHTVDTVSGSVPAVPEVPATTNSNPLLNNVNVPMSHLITGNQYPSLSGMPNAAIAQSFAPVYRSYENPSPSPQVGADIYQEYIQNPYNLTLQQPDLDGNESQHVIPALHQQSQHIYQNSVANYFASKPSDNSAIPPGSEILFGQQS